VSWRSRIVYIELLPIRKQLPPARLGRSTLPTTTMPPRQQHDPFTDAPLRPTTGNPALRSQPSQHSLRSNASTASSRSRAPRDLFAPHLSRRPTSRATPRVEDEVLADPVSDEELTVPPPRQSRRIRQGSPEKHSRARVRDGEELDIVNRQPNGSYILESGVGVNYEGQHLGLDDVDGKEEESMAGHVKIARDRR
jgi:hypothetical protein